MILNAVHKGHGVYHKMIVQVIGLIQMGSNHHLIFFTPQFFGQLQPDLMGGLWVGLSGGKALIAVIGHRAVLLPEPLFDCDISSRA